MRNIAMECGNCKPLHILEKRSDLLLILILHPAENEVMRSMKVNLNCYNTIHFIHCIH